jgi:hypothetical protein
VAPLSSVGAVNGLSNGSHAQGGGGCPRRGRQQHERARLVEVARIAVGVTRRRPALRQDDDMVIR